VDFSWKDGKLQLVTVRSTASGSCNVRYQEHVTPLVVPKGGSASFGIGYHTSPPSKPIIRG